MRIIHSLFILLFIQLLPFQAEAHVSGYTDTSIQITNVGIRIIYTSPSDSLKELVKTDHSSLSVTSSPDEYLSKVQDGWDVSSNNGQRCLLVKSKAIALDSLPSFQFQLTYVCPSGLSQVLIKYNLFIQKYPEHENFSRVFMANQRMQKRFTAQNNELVIPVEKLLTQWNIKLAQGFFDSDPNRGPKNNIEGATPNIVEPSISLGYLDLSKIDPGFIHLGLEHIFSGLDHVMFVVGLVLTIGSWRRLFALVTTFTVAHSVTLALSTMQIIHFLPSITEPLIAVTILYIGLEGFWTYYRSGSAKVNDEGSSNIWRQISLVFIFGLIHGVGFSYILHGMGLREDLLGTLLYFNFGVELGQLGILCLAIPSIMYLRRLTSGRMLLMTSSVTIALMGAIMFFQRLPFI